MTTVPAKSVSNVVRLGPSVHAMSTELTAATLSKPSTVKVAPMACNRLWVPTRMAALQIAVGVVLWMLVTLLPEVLKLPCPQLCACNT